MLLKDQAARERWAHLLTVSLGWNNMIYEVALPSKHTQKCYNTFLKQPLIIVSPEKLIIQ